MEGRRNELDRVRNPLCTTRVVRTDVPGWEGGPVHDPNTPPEYDRPT